MSRRRGQAKRRRRKRPKLTDEQRIALEVSRREAENGIVARAERRLRRVMEVMGDELRPPPRQDSDLSRFELAELERMNARRSDPLLALPDSAYEARRLARYTDA